MKYTEENARRLSNAYKWWCSATKHGKLTDLGAGCDNTTRKRRALTTPIRKTKMACLDWELRQWYTDEIEHLTSRADSGLLMHQARYLRDILLEQGWSEEACPRITKQWLHRWREKFNISMRMTTVRFKISALD